MLVYEDCCEVAGIDKKEVKRIAKALSKYIKEANKLGMIVFGGSTNGSLMYDDNDSEYSGQRLVLAHLDGETEGGDGACDEDHNGLMRTE